MSPNPLPHSTFNLVDRLAAKASAALIARDDEHFTAITTNVEETVADLTQRLDTARRAPGGAGQAAMDRDMEIHRLSARLRALRRHGADLCLGHMVLDDHTQPVYIGRLGLSDNTGHQLLIDWRSPAAEPFFGATHGNPMGVARRRRYHWTNGQVSDYWDEVFTPEALFGQDVPSSVPDTFGPDSPALDDQSAFIATLAAGRSSRMRDVLGTIAADQDAVVRAGSRGTLVVDGGPGTGKTVVALHRTAYLLYSDPRLGHHRGGVLFVGPHEPYLAYVADVLPSLGEEGVALCTVADLVTEGATAPAERDLEVARLKSSAAMVDAIEAAVRFYEEPPRAGMTVATDWDDIWLGPADWSSAFDVVELGTAHNEAREKIWNELVDILVSRHDAAVPGDQLRKSLPRNIEFRSAVARAWPVIDAAELVGDLWSVPAYLRKCAPWLRSDEISALQRENPRAWTTADLPLLDAARRRLGDPDASRLESERRSALANERERRSEVTAQLLAANDDNESLITMLGGNHLRETLVDESAVPFRDNDNLAGPFAHIVVDEAQELTDAQWQMLIARCPSRSFTVVGDRAQSRAGFTESWQERLARVGLDRIKVTGLSVNYRTPDEVMRAAEPEIRAALPNANVPTSIRSNGIPVTYRATCELEAILDDWIAEHLDGTACVIGEPTFRARDRIRSLTPTMAKGLEFDLVVVVEPDAFGHGIEGAVDRYVAMTRATQQLVVLIRTGRR